MDEENTEENSSNHEENDSESLHPVNSPSVTNEEYFAALEIWLRDTYMMMNMHMHMQFLSMLYQYNQTLLANRPQDMTIPLTLHIPPSDITFRQTRAQTTPHVVAHPTPHQPEGAILYVIPKLWKRLVAELIDFFILCILKFILTFFLIDLFEFIELDEFLMAKYNYNIDYDAAMKITSEIIFLEIIHRIIVFIYEGYFLQRQSGNQHMGGATPGKIYMGLRVVRCDQVIPIGQEPYFVCWVKPGTNLDLTYSFTRSFAKNILLVVVFPLWFGYFLFQYNRTGYDVVCHTMVVEVENQFQRRQRRPAP